MCESAWDMLSVYSRKCVGRVQCVCACAPPWMTKFGYVVHLTTLHTIKALSQAVTYIGQKHGEVVQVGSLCSICDERAKHMTSHRVFSLQTSQVVQICKPVVGQGRSQMLAYRQIIARAALRLSGWHPHRHATHIHTHTHHRKKERKKGKTRDAGK